MNIKNKFIILIIILLFFNFIGRGFGLYFHYIIISIINILFIPFLLKINPFKKVGLFLIFLPLFISTPNIIIALIENKFKPGLIGEIMYIFTIIFSVIVYKYSYRKIIIVIYIIFDLLLIYNYDNIFNYYIHTFEKFEINKNFPEIQIIDRNKKLYSIPKNKIIVIDLWSIRCGNCIKDFPKFQKVKDKYMNDKEVEIISLNIFMNFNEINNSLKYVKNYTFENYFTDESIFKKLNFNGVPNYIIIGKDNKIKYFGSLNNNINENYNNIYELIEEQK